MKFLIGRTMSHIFALGLGLLLFSVFNMAWASNTNLSAVVVGSQYTITSSTDFHGNISPLGAVTVLANDSQTFTISADPGYIISNVLVDGISVGAVNTYTFANVTADHTIAVSTSIISYTIVSSAGSGGSISPLGSVGVDSFNNKTFNIAPSIGHFIKNVKVDSVSQGAIAVYTFFNVTADHAIEAFFDSYPTTIDNPTNLVGTAGDTITNLFWTNPNSAYFIYNKLYRSTIPGVLGGVIASPSGTNYTDHNLTNGVTYYYTLKAFDSLGNISTGTPQLALTPTGLPDIIAPTGPLNLKADSIGMTSVSLSWDGSTDNVGVVGYKLYNADTNVLIATTSETHYIVNNLTPDTVYHFYCVAYDAAGNISAKSNILEVKTKPGQSVINVSMNLSAPGQAVVGVALNTKVKVTVFDGGGVVAKNYQGSIYFTSTDANAIFKWNKFHQYVFTVSDAGQVEFDGADFIFKSVGHHTLTVTDGQIKADAQLNVTKETNDVFSQTLDKIKSLDKSQADSVAKSVNTTVMTTVTTALAIPIVVNTLLSTINIWPQIFYILTNLFQLLGARRRRKPWGTVFNAQTGQPITFAIVKIFDHEYNRLLERAVTDDNGRFGFLIKKGTYYLTAQKKGYIFPSMVENKGFFDNIYTGQIIETSESDQVIVMNIPFDPQTKPSGSYKFSVALVKLRHFFELFRTVILVVGIIVALVFILLSFQIFYLLSLIFYLLIAFWQFIKTKRPRSYGVVTDTSGQMLEAVIVRIYDKKTNRLIETDVTDSEGRFKFMVNPGIYYITAAKPEFIDFESHIMSLEKEQTLISIDIKMKKQTESISPITRH